MKYHFMSRAMQNITAVAYIFISLETLLYIVDYVFLKFIGL